jgi:hypothetical protein
MATDSAVRSVTNTLTTTLADTVTITQAWPSVDITNHSSSAILYFRVDGSTAVAAADNNGVILSGQSKVVALPINSSGQGVVSVIGSGNIYTIEGVN